MLNGADRTVGSVEQLGVRNMETTMPSYDLSPYEDTVDEVLDQYPLTEKQKVIVKCRIDTSCPWFRRNAYMRAHHEASQYLNEQ